MLEFLLQELELVVLGSDALANAVLKVFGVALIPVNLNTRWGRARGYLRSPSTFGRGFVRTV